MFSFNLFAIPIRVEPWFWLTMVFIGGGLRAQSSIDMLYVLMFVLAGFISVLVHELGHALTIRKFGLPTEITLHGFGGYATFPPGKLDRRQSFLVTAAGPGLQIALALLLIVFNKFVPIPSESLMKVLVDQLIIISIFWALLNCLPIYPMDGGQMMAAVLGPRREHLVHLLSVFLAIAIGLASFLYLHSFLLPIFMALFAFQNWQMYENSARR